MPPGFVEYPLTAVYSLTIVREIPNQDGWLPTQYSASRSPESLYRLYIKDANGIYSFVSLGTS
jgi:hypothetical protein